MDRAVEQANQCLAKPRAIGEQRRRECFELKIELHTLVVAFLRRKRRRMHQLFCIDGRELQLQIARQQAPRVDDFVDELELLLRLADNRLARAHIAGIVQRLALDELGPSDDAVERPSEIVGNDTQIVV